MKTQMVFGFNFFACLIVVNASAVLPETLVTTTSVFLSTVLGRQVSLYHVYVNVGFG